MTADGCPQYMTRRTDDDETQRRRGQRQTASQRALGDPLHRRGRPQPFPLDGRTKRDVTDRLRDALGDAGRGIRPESQQLTTGDYLDEWLASLTVRPRTVESYGHVVRHYLTPALGRVPLAKLQPEHVTRMLRDLAKGQPPPLPPSGTRTWSCASRSAEPSSSAASVATWRRSSTLHRRPAPSFSR